MRVCEREQENERELSNSRNARNRRIGEHSHEVKAIIPCIWIVKVVSTDFNAGHWSNGIRNEARMRVMTGNFS